MKTKIFIVLTFFYIVFSFNAYTQCSCARCRNKSKRFTLLSWLGLEDKRGTCSYYRKTLDSIVQVSEKKFRISPPKNSFELAPLYYQIDNMIPKRSKRYYRAIEDFKIDSEEILKLFKKKEEKTEGLKEFFNSHLAKIQKDNDTTYIPMLVLRARDKKDNKIWIIHMNWEKNEKIESDESGATVPEHLLSYAIEYDTGKILYEEK